ncbi:MAG: YqgE/AlgH family protein [Acidobacteria bacterium]|nr:YqgE/AlgH family protein [Acidobacteriota bacterium]MBI3489328.1 YqgE/AlgH family protein [Acidobacteriota bacterium]
MCASLQAYCLAWAIIIGIMSYEAPCLLVASPALLDPNFLHSVVLIVEHDEEGALGLILNRPLPLSLAQVCEEGGMAFQGSEEATAWRGGPVDPQRGILLSQGGLPEEEDTVVDLTHFVSHRKDLLETLLNDPTARYRLFLGYAGWSPGQLDQELSLGAWMRRPVVSEWLMHPDPSGLWQVALAAGS